MVCEPHVQSGAMTALLDELSAWYESPREWLRTKAVLAFADSMGFGDRAREVLMDKRRERLRKEVVQQRKWQTKVSRRPLRGYHSDSWAIREQYVSGHRAGAYAWAKRTHRMSRSVWDGSGRSEVDTYREWVKANEGDAWWRF